MDTKIHGTFTSYTVGFLLALALTLLAFQAVISHWFSGAGLTMFIMSLAATQLVVQLLFFLHMGREPKPRWRSATFMFMLIVLIILVGGSLWIMNNLNYSMSPDQMNKAILKDEGIQL